MGLSGRKTKQRIPNDPRNLAWANDANKFGAAYLAKLGWDPSRGLGVSGEGRTTALTVNQKLDMLGIGADHRNSAEGIAWKQNKEFENLLRRLNAANGSGEAQKTEEPMKIDGFVRPISTSSPPGEEAQDDVVEGQENADEDGEKRSMKKRKKGLDDGEGEGKKKRRKSKAGAPSEVEGETKKDKKKKKRDVEDATPLAVTPEAEMSASSPLPVRRSAPSRHPRASFRAKHMAAKNIASKSASAIAEVLGFSPTTSASASGYPSSAPTPYASTPFEPGPSTSSKSGPSGFATPAEELKLQDLSVSSKSVMDYFKEKLAAKSNARVFASSISAPSTPAATEYPDDYDERPRIGLGASRLRNEMIQLTEPAEVEERRGLGGIGSGMRSSFAAMFTSAQMMNPNTNVEQVQAEEDGAGDDDVSNMNEDRKGKERKKKTMKHKGKEKVDEEPQSCRIDPSEEVGEREERKRRKEEKRRRKEAKAQASTSLAVEAVSEPEAKERKPKEKKSRAER